MHVKKKSKHVRKMKKNTVDTDLNLLVGCCCVKEKKKLNPEKMKMKIKTTWENQTRNCGVKRALFLPIAVSRNGKQMRDFTRNRALKVHERVAFTLR